MFLSEMLARQIHAVRVRDLERAATQRRLLAEPIDPVAPVRPTTVVSLPPGEPATTPVLRPDGSSELAA